MLKVEAHFMGGLPYCEWRPDVSFLESWRRLLPHWISTVRNSRVCVSSSPVIHFQIIVAAESHTIGRTFLFPFYPTHSPAAKRPRSIPMDDGSGAGVTVAHSPLELVRTATQFAIERKCMASISGQRNDLAAGRR
jgi:hypothetical protein